MDIPLVCQPWASTIVVQALAIVGPIKMKIIHLQDYHSVSVSVTSIIPFQIQERLSRGAGFSLCFASTLGWYTTLMLISSNYVMMLNQNKMLYFILFLS